MQPNPTVINQHITDTLRDYRLNRKGTALSYIRLARKFAGIPGIPKTKVLAIIDANFPAEAKAYHEAESRGDVLPPIFGHRPGYEQRLASARRTGIVH